MGHTTEIAHHHTKAMVERYRDAHARTGLDSSRLSHEERVVDEIAMRKCRPLRQSGGAAGELDVDGVVHLDRRRYGVQAPAANLLASLQDPVECQAAIVLPCDRDNVSQLREARALRLAASVSQLGDKLADHCDIVARLEACGGDQRATSHGSQGLLQLTQAISWIDVDEDQAGLRRRELRNCPFRAIRGPDADAVAWLKAEGQKPRGESVAARLEFRVGPPNLLVCNNQRFARSVSRAHFVQKG